MELDENMVLIDQNLAAIKSEDLSKIEVKEIHNHFQRNKTISHEIKGKIKDHFFIDNRHYFVCVDDVVVTDSDFKFLESHHLPKTLYSCAQIDHNSIVVGCYEDGTIQSIQLAPFKIISSLNFIDEPL